MDSMNFMRLEISVFSHSLAEMTLVPLLTDDLTGEDDCVVISCKMSLFSHSRDDGTIGWSISMD